MLKTIKGLKILSKKEQSSVKAGYDPFSWFSSCDAYATINSAAHLQNNNLDYNTGTGFAVYSVIYEEEYNRCVDDNLGTY